MLPSADHVEIPRSSV